MTHSLSLAYFTLNNNDSLNLSLTYFILNNNDSLTLSLTYFVLFAFFNRQNLELRDGGSVRSPLLYTANPMGKSLSLLTRYNLLWIHYRTNKTGSDFTADKDKFSFNLEYTTYSEFKAHSLFIVFYYEFKFY